MRTLRHREKEWLVKVAQLGNSGIGSCAFVCLSQSPLNGSASPIPSAIPGKWAGRQAFAAQWSVLVLRWEDRKLCIGSPGTGAVLPLSSCVVLIGLLSVSEVPSYRLSEADNISFLLQAWRGLSWILYVNILYSWWCPLQISVIMLFHFPLTTQSLGHKSSLGPL